MLKELYVLYRWLLEPKQHHTVKSIKITANDFPDNGVFLVKMGPDSISKRLVLNFINKYENKC